MVMMNEEINGNNVPQYCKKCGEELPSTEKHTLCINCRKKRGAKIRKKVLEFVSFCGVGFYVNQLVNNSSDILSGSQEGETDDYRKS